MFHVFVDLQLILFDAEESYKTWRSLRGGGGLGQASGASGATLRWVLFFICAKLAILYLDHFISNLRVIIREKDIFKTLKKIHKIYFYDCFFLKLFSQIFKNWKWIKNSTHIIISFWKIISCIILIWMLHLYVTESLLSTLQYLRCCASIGEW